jgi:hypothetical protein
MIVYSHLEIGLYQLCYKRLELRLIYMCLTFGVLHSSDASGGDLTTITYLIPLNMVAYYVC